MGHIDKHGNSALTLAIHRNMEVVAIEIVKSLFSRNALSTSSVVIFEQ